jgi:hypothetical protein
MRSDGAFFSRQSELISSGLGQFRRGEITLNALTNYLRALRDAVSHFDPEWLTKFSSAWSVLEEVNAVQLDEAHRPPTDLENRLVAEALLRLEVLARQLSQEDS